MLGVFYRVFSFFGKWLAEVVRQPALIITLVLGPFAILLAFGEGVSVTAPPPRTVIVAPEGNPDPLQPLPEDLTQFVDVVGVTENLEAARAELREGDIEAVIVIPEGSLNFVERGEHVPIRILTDVIDPVARTFVNAYLTDQVQALNERTIERAVSEATEETGDLESLTADATGDLESLTADARRFLELARGARGNLEQMRGEVQQLQEVLAPLTQEVNRATTLLSTAGQFVPGLDAPAARAERLRAELGDLREAVDELEQQLAEAEEDDALPTDEELSEIDRELTELESAVLGVTGVPPEVLASPFALEIEHVSPFIPSFTGFFAPAVLALLVQHLGITLGALSMARIRLLGLTELLKVAPIRPAEVVVGNYLSYGVLTAVAAATLLALLVLVLGVPVFGSWLLLVVMLLFLILASVGLGLIVSIISANEQQAAQVAMLILLAAIFFSGFVFSLERIIWPVRAISYLLPSTYAIRGLQDVMLRGVLRTEIDVIVLGVAALVLFFVTIFLVRRELRAR